MVGKDYVESTMAFGQCRGKALDGFAAGDVQYFAANLRSGSREPLKGFGNTGRVAASQIHGVVGFEPPGQSFRQRETEITGSACNESYSDHVFIVINILIIVNR
jgi:hypothetical protein